MPTEVVTALSGEITAGNLWAAITPVVGIVAIVAVFAFGYRVLNRVLRKSSSGNPGM